MTWSLGVEEQFYAVIPLLMVLLTRIRRAWLLPSILAVSALSFLYAWNQLGSSPMMAFYMLPARAWELGAGVALAAAELHRNRRALSTPIAQVASLAGLALLLAPVYLLTAATPFPGPAALPTVLGTALLIAAPASWINRRILAMPPLGFIGRISYSWYLWHWPMIAFLRVINGGDLPPQPAPIVVMAASLIPAMLSYHFIEQPFRRSNRQPVPLLLRYAAVTTAFLAASGAIWLAHGLPQRFPELARIESAAQALKSDRCLVGERDAPNQTPACYDVLSTHPSIAIWGDSHAAAIAPGLRSAAGAQGYGFVELAKNSCLPLTGATHYLPQVPQRAAACTRFDRKTLAMLQAEPRIRIVILAASWAAPFNRNQQDGWLTPDSAPASPTPSIEASGQLFTQSLAATTRALLASGKQVIVFQDTPNFDFDPMMNVRTAQIPARHKLAAWLQAPDAADPYPAAPYAANPGAAPPVNEPSLPLSVSLIERTVAGSQGVQLIDLRRVFCGNPAQCTYRNGESLFFSDSSHLTPAGAALAVQGLQFPAPATTPR
jgi:hypothetical protein